MVGLTSLRRRLRERATGMGDVYTSAAEGGKLRENLVHATPRESITQPARSTGYVS
jgi:hypothetical protein